MQRKAIFAGTWYPETKSAIEQTIKNFVVSENSIKSKAIGIMVPHAGWIYSGKVAAQVYNYIDIPDTVVLIGPNHTGRGYMVSLADWDSWETPLGEVPVDKQLSRTITQWCGGTITLDNLAHSGEHSLEIQLPFLQYFRKDIKIVPIIISTQAPEICKIVGEGVAGAIKELRRPCLVLASSDMTHYESKQKAEEKDRLAIQKIIALDPEQLLGTVAAHDISMCGVAPAATMLFAARTLGAQKAELVKYDTSGTITGDDTEVVGYAGIIVT